MKCRLENAHGGMLLGSPRRLIAPFRCGARVPARSPMSGAALPATAEARRRRTRNANPRAVRLRRLPQERNATRHSGRDGPVLPIFMERRVTGGMIPKRKTRVLRSGTSRKRNVSQKAKYRALYQWAQIRSRFWNTLVQCQDATLPASRSNVHPNPLLSSVRETIPDTRSASPLRCASQASTSESRGCFHRTDQPDPLLPHLIQLFEKGDLVTIDKGSRIPPLEVPIKAEWFGIPSFREVGVVSREVRYKISVLDERANKALDARGKGTSGLREKFSFPLADGSRWMPHKAKPFFQAELKRLEEAGRTLLGSIVSGDPKEWVENKRDLVTRDANRQYEEFHPGKHMPEEIIQEILNALTERFRKATSAHFLPKVSFVKTGFRLGGDSEQVSGWAAARTLLRAVAEYPRSALKDRAYFFRGLQVSEEDLLTAMNVVEDPLVAEWFKPRSLHTAREEMEVLDQIDESEHSDRDKCGLIMDVLSRARPLDDILSVAKQKVEYAATDAKGA